MIRINLKRVAHVLYSVYCHCFHLWWRGWDWSQRERYLTKYVSDYQFSSNRKNLSFISLNKFEIKDPSRSWKYEVFVSSRSMCVECPNSGPVTNMGITTYIEQTYLWCSKGFYDNRWELQCFYQNGYWLHTCWYQNLY